MKILYYANTAWYLFNFRLALLRALRDLGHEVVLITPPGDYGAALEREGFRWRPIPLQRRSLNPLTEFRHLARLCLVLRQERPDLVHNFTIKCVVYGSIAARMAGGAAVVNALVGLGHLFSQAGRGSRLLAAMVRRLVRISCASAKSRVIVQNSGDFDAVIEKGMARQERLSLIRGSGVDTDRFSPAARGARDEPAMVLFASRLLRAKGIAEFVEAAKALREKGAACRFVAAGAPDPGNPGAVSERDLGEWKSSGAVDFVGHRDDVLDLLHQASMVVLVSSYGEGVPRILVEAAACGLPLIVSDQAGCREIVADKVNGLVLPAGDGKALASAVEYLLENPEERRLMGEKGREKAVAEFDVKLVIDQTLRVYRELLSGF